MQIGKIEMATNTGTYLDPHNIDDTWGKQRPVHKILLGNTVSICKHLTNLDQLSLSGIRFYAVPLKITGVQTFPARTFAQVWTG